MDSRTLLINLLLFTLTFWLGLYSLAQVRQQRWFWLAAPAALAFSAGRAAAVLLPYSPSYNLTLLLVRGERILLVLPVLCWLLIFWLLVPNFAAWNERYRRQPRLLLLLTAGMLLYAAAITWWIFPTRRGGETAIALLTGADLFFLGTMLIMLSAQERGEAWMSSYFRALDYAFFTALLFGGQVGLVIWLATGVNFPLLLLLLGVIGAAVLVQIFSDPVQALLDRIAFAHAPRVRRRRQALRAESTAVQRLDPTLDLRRMPAETFTQHTRRALSDMGNLPRLAANPLVQLPLIDRRLHRENGAGGLAAADRTLTRALVLKQLLTEAIAQLKPQEKGAFGTTDEWRFYNALYFPYVLGVRPYRRSLDNTADFGEEAEAVALASAWFSRQVPRRTLYNWQNKAAALIARDLREQLRRLPV